MPCLESTWGKKPSDSNPPSANTVGGGGALIGARSRRKYDRAASTTVQSRRVLDPPPLVERPSSYTNKAKGCKDSVANAKILSDIIIRGKALSGRCYS